MSVGAAAGCGGGALGTEEVEGNVYPTSMLTKATNMRPETAAASPITDMEESDMLEEGRGDEGREW